MRYVTFDTDGNLTGCYLQDLREEHSNAHFEVDEAITANWPAYRMNAARDGLELVSSVALPEE